MVTCRRRAANGRGSRSSRPATRFRTRAACALAQRALDLACALGAEDQLLVLLSGGGSAVAAAPAPGVTLADKQATTHALLRSGATIAEINGVRKHLSRLKGGRLAAAAAPARVTTWIIADVPGDDPFLVASGPTVADRTDLAMARAVVAHYGIPISTSVARALADPANESPASDSPGLAEADVHILGGADNALAAAVRRAGERGLAVNGLGDWLDGEARQLGANHAAIAQSIGGQLRPALLLSGGETSVRLRGQSQRGGRNLEYLLALAIALDGAPGISAIACDTDGIDGASDAAGAMVFSDTLARASALGLNARDHLERHDSHAFFATLDDLVKTGPTLTNVGDFRAILFADA
jgi:glycerate 2-kinase